MFIKCIDREGEGPKTIYVSKYKIVFMHAMPTLNNDFLIAFQPENGAAWVYFHKRFETIESAEIGIQEIQKELKQ